MNLNRKKLLEIDKEWEKEFKQSLFEGVTDINTFIKVAIEEYFPIWKEENPDLINIYEYFEDKIISMVR